MKISGSAAIALLLLSVASPSAAQIYSWRDAKGQLVLSDRPLDPSARTFAIPKAPGVRVTRPVPTAPPRAYDALIDEQAAAQGVRADLVRAVIQVESAFNPSARSVKGALGLMQLMPGTALEHGVGNPFNPAENIRGGVAYLRKLLDRYENNEELALAAYNAGPSAVDRHGSRVPPYRETRQYVQKIRGKTSVSDTARPRTIYKTTEIVDGKPVPRYSDTKPASGPFEVVTIR
jgi:soluble lytic murein transglycosylase-like protein